MIGTGWRSGQDDATRGIGERPRDQCGVFAVYNYRGPGGAGLMSYLGLLALQHRGQESAGMAYLDDQQRLRCLKGMGLVGQVFSRSHLDGIGAPTILGHVRYSTTGTSTLANAQPLIAHSHDGTSIALAHNGNLTNTRRLHARLLNEGQIFHSTSDSEIILTYLFRYRREGMVEAIRKTMAIIEGAYVVVISDGHRLAAFRDPCGFRPLVIGACNNSLVFASETAALDAVGATFKREVLPGEIVTAGPDGLQSVVGLPAKEAFCIFEFIYFARPDSVIGGKSVHLARKEVGALLAGRLQELPDLVVPSPDSGLSAAAGLADALGIPLEYAIHRNPYLGRTFIEPTQGDREMAVRLKFNPIEEIVRGKKVAVVDDSLVRGTTARVLTDRLRACGAAAVHLCIASPPYRYPCYYGIDIPLGDDLAAREGDEKDLAAAVNANSVTFARPEDLFFAAGKEPAAFCSACFDGNYPAGG